MSDSEELMPAGRPRTIYDRNEVEISIFLVPFGPNLVELFVWDNRADAEITRIKLDTIPSWGLALETVKQDQVTRAFLQRLGHSDASAVFRLT